jgi:hypothetical protein
MMGSVKQTGKKRIYWFEYEYLNNKGKWVKTHREFGTEAQANHAHLTMTLRKHRNPSKYRSLTYVSWADSWSLLHVGLKHDGRK